MSIISFTQHLNARRQAEAPPARQQELQAAAEQFEALFLQQILKQMRKAGDVLSEGSSVRSREMDTFRSLHDEILAETLAGQKQAGIADLLVRQLSGNLSPEALEQAGESAREAPLERTTSRPSMSLVMPLAERWNQGVDRLGGLWKQGSAAFQALVDGVIRQESGGRVDAVSPKGARGLMQLMPDTAREVAARLGLAFDESRLTADGAYNKRLGSAYLGQLLERYDGHGALALAAYNAGPGKVDEWLRAHGDPRRGEIGIGEWIERIPYRETRDYTRRILEGLGMRHQPLAPTGEPVLKSAAETVALTEKSASEAGATHHLRSPAFAAPIPRNGLRESLSS